MLMFHQVDLSTIAEEDQSVEADVDLARTSLDNGLYPRTPSYPASSTCDTRRNKSPSMAFLCSPRFRNLFCGRSCRHRGV